MKADGVRIVNWAMIALGVLAVVIGVAVPGFQIAPIILGGLLAGWGSFGLLTEE